MKEYEFYGSIDYAHAISFTIEAKNKKEAKKLALIKADKCIDNSQAEFQKIYLDEPNLLGVK